MKPALLVTMLAATAVSCDFEDIAPRTPWNGHKVFLSPAHHGPEGGDPRDNTGCFDYSENNTTLSMARGVARAATGLAEAGYKVRIGRRDRFTNTENSNEWGSTVHIPIHSNAATADCEPPYNLDNGASGTVVFHYPGSSKGRVMADSIDFFLSPLSPGRGQDKVKTQTFTELARTRMPAAYVETAFHTFGADTEWLREQQAEIVDVIAFAIDHGIHAWETSASSQP